MFPFLIYLLIESVSIFPMNRITAVTALRPVIRTVSMASTMASVVPPVSFSAQCPVISQVKQLSS